jgi:hypothetical protein
MSQEEAQKTWDNSGRNKFEINKKVDPTSKTADDQQASSKTSDMNHAM